MPKKKVFDILSEADIFVFNLKRIEVLKYGISSNKLFDYMATGKPIISSVNTVENPVDKSGCGISIPPESPEIMANEIEKLYLTSPEEREIMGTRGREYVKKYHDYKILADKLDQCIKLVLS